MYLDHLAAGERCHWFTTLYRGRRDGRRFRQLSMLAAAMGGHVRTGLGDCPTLDGRSDLTNADMVRMAVDLAHAAGRSVATAADTRDLLRIRA
jgi:3-keto-5-aminohexanoate cleavage enzyme